MFELNTKIADRIIDALHGSGPEKRAYKAVRAYRKAPTDANKAVATELLELLDQNKQAEMRAAARV